MDLPSGYQTMSSGSVGLDNSVQYETKSLKSSIKYKKKKSKSYQIETSSLKKSASRGGRSRRCLSSRSRFTEHSSAVEKMDSGLNLARVTAGDVICNVEEHNKVSKRNNKMATRSKGVSVRLTKMYYAVAKDGKINEERIQRFCKQMSFERRAKGLMHGSLVTGVGSWGGPTMAPIKLSKFIPDPNSIWNIFQAHTNVNVIQFYGNPPSVYSQMETGKPIKSKNGKFEVLKENNGTIYTHKL